MKSVSAVVWMRIVFPYHENNVASEFLGMLMQLEFQQSVI